MQEAKNDFSDEFEITKSDSNSLTDVTEHNSPNFIEKSYSLDQDSIQTLTLKETYIVNPSNFNFAPEKPESLQKIQIPGIKKIVLVKTGIVVFKPNEIDFV